MTTSPRPTRWVATTTGITLAALLATGCASTPTASEGQPGASLAGERASVKVAYTKTFIDGSSLKEQPTEVTIVRRANTQKEVGKQVMLNVLMLGLGGGVGMQGFSKSQLQGDLIELAGDRGNLVNPVPDAFVSRLNGAIAAAIQSDPSLPKRSWSNPVLVAGGQARLLYTELGGADEEQFNLVLSLEVFKRKESASMLSITSPVVKTPCGGSSDKPMPLADWSANQYERVKTEFTALLEQCEKNVLAALPALLKE